MTYEDTLILNSVRDTAKARESLALDLGISTPRLYQRLRQLCTDPDVSLQHPREVRMFWALVRRGR